jgi:RNA polymerase sigma-70 factor
MTMGVHINPVPPGARGSDRSDFDRLAAGAFQRGRLCHGDLDLQPEAHASRLLSIAQKYLGPEASWISVIEFAGGLHTDDLYLATACAQRGDAAWRRFTVVYGNCLNELSRYVGQAADAREMANLTLIDMFLPDRSGESRIASYDGRSSLATWLRVIVSNRAINERQRMCNRIPHLPPTPEIADGGALRKMESGLREDRYGSLLNDSLQSACLELDDRERLILLWRYEQGLQLGQIARLLAVHQSTVTRQLERLLGKLRNTVIAILASKYQLSQAAIEECLSLIFDSSAKEVSILGFIKENRAARLEHTLIETPGRAEKTPPRRAAGVRGWQTRSQGD